MIKIKIQINDGQVGEGHYDYFINFPFDELKIGHTKFLLPSPFFPDQPFSNVYLYILEDIPGESILALKKLPAEDSNLYQLVFADDLASFQNIKVVGKPKIYENEEWVFLGDKFFPRWQNVITMEKLND